jgi:hypothetical protein
MLRSPNLNAARVVNAPRRSSKCRLQARVLLPTALVETNSGEATPNAGDPASLPALYKANEKGKDAGAASRHMGPCKPMGEKESDAVHASEHGRLVSFPAR